MFSPQRLRIRVSSRTFFNRLDFRQTSFLRIRDQRKAYVPLFYRVLKNITIRSICSVRLSRKFNRYGDCINPVCARIVNYILTIKVFDGLTI